ncbi:MAG: hypothetical protein IPI02_01080 [Sterolibacteriaceae bacterium]|nr:hypothetical protein [Sterolibacteriaceae bacterium]
MASTTRWWISATTRLAYRKASGPSRKQEDGPDSTSRPASKIFVGDVDGNGQDDLLFDFGIGQGLWLLSNGSAWRQIDTRIAKNLLMVDLDGDGKDEIVADFGRGSGI